MIAQRHNTTPEQLRVANCLLTNALIPGSRLFVPPAPVSTPVRCGPPPGWIKGFTVHRGDTLFSISQSYGISLASLKLANCKDDRNLIFDGEVLWVPNITTRTPTMTSSSVPDYVTVYPTDPLTETSLPFTATIIPSNTPVPATNTVPATHDDS
jgi:LysM repeat protein